MKKNKGPKVLFVDIETAPMEAWVWASWDQNIPFNMLKTDWSILSWSAKWQGQKKIMYEDNRYEKDPRNDKNILKNIHKLLDEAHVVVWQNGKSFDYKKLNTRFLMNDMKPPSPYKQIDTKVLAKKYFAMTHNSLDYMSSKLNKTFHKHKHKKFVGFELWKACLEGNEDAWNEMRTYNKLDVLSLEELYDNIQAWGTGIDFNLYNDDLDVKCNCGSINLQRRGFNYSSAGKFQRLQCLDCGGWSSSKKNLLSKDKRSSLLKK